MRKNWLTTLFGILAGGAALLHSQGVTLGHLGAGDWTQFIQAIGVAGVGLSAADANKNQPQ